MKKMLLVLLLLGINVSLHAQLHTGILDMSPRDRKFLAQSMKETADIYQELNRTQKANEYYTVSLKVYPIGDSAHQLANQLGILLDDEQTYSNFIAEADKTYEYAAYDRALSLYFMANELEAPLDLYKKIADTYTMLEDSENASYYNTLAKGDNPADGMILEESTMDAVPAELTADDTMPTDSTEPAIADTIFTETEENPTMDEYEYGYDYETEEDEDETMDEEEMDEEPSIEEMYDY